MFISEAKKVLQDRIKPFKYYINVIDNDKRKQIWN